MCSYRPEFGQIYVLISARIRVHLWVFVQSYCFKDGFQRVCSEILFKDLFQRVCLAIFKDLFKHKNQRFCSHIFSAFFFQSYVFSDVFHDFPMIFQRFVTSFFNGLDRPQPRHEHMSIFTNKNGAVGFNPLKFSAFESWHEDCHQIFRSKLNASN